MANDRMKCTVSGSVLTWEYGNGLSPLSVDVAGLTDELQAMARLHGIRQKVQDAAALEFRQANGVMKRPTMAEKRERMAEMISRLVGGQWNADEREPNATGLFAALRRLAEAGIARYAQFAEMDAEGFRQWADSKAAELALRNRAEVTRAAIYKALRNQPDVAAEIARGSGTPEIDVDSIL